MRDIPFTTGNVIKSPCGGLWIVAEIRGDLVEAIAFDAANCTATQRLDDHTDNRECGGGECDDEECQRCYGRGTYVADIKGWRHSKVLAESAQDYIARTLRRAAASVRGK
jgi:hypothetical protein